MSKPILVVNIAGLGHVSVGENTPNLSELIDKGGEIVPLQPPVPALTSPSQATILTGTLPKDHGIVGNGWYFRELAQILNWQRSANLVDGETIWDAARRDKPDLRCANLFWRYATHSSCDVNVIERPTYWADGRKGPDIYTEPATIRDELVEQFGPFPLFRFWGPVAGIQSTRWIVDATLHLLENDEYDLLFTYLPHLDYEHQRFGPDSEQGAEALKMLDVEAGRLIEAANEHGFDIAIVSDYAFEKVSQPVFLNRVLREADFITVDHAKNGELLEPGASRAFAVCDQQIAHIYVNDEDARDEVAKLLAATDGVGQLLDQNEMNEQGLAHHRSGQMLAIAEADCWFAYPYWLDESNAPDFARCVAIHDKPGFDPVELFREPGLKGDFHLGKRILQSRLGIRAPFDVISTDATMVGGSHGRIPESDETRAVLLTSWTAELESPTPMQDVKSILLRRIAS